MTNSIEITLEEFSHIIENDVKYGFDIFDMQLDGDILNIEDMCGTVADREGENIIEFNIVSIDEDDQLNTIISVDVSQIKTPLNEISVKNKSEIIRHMKSHNVSGLSVFEKYNYSAPKYGIGNETIDIEFEALTQWCFELDGNNLEISEYETRTQEDISAFRLFSSDEYETYKNDTAIGIVGSVEEYRARKDGDVTLIQESGDLFETNGEINPGDINFEELFGFEICTSI